MSKTPVHFLVADDDMDDRMMLTEAFSENRLLNYVHFVKDGVELLDYLNRKGHFEDVKAFPTPGIILLDLNMPRMDGREVLKELKNHPQFKSIPVIILTTSKTEEDILRTYELGVNSFISKPVTFDSLVSVIRDIGKYWIEVVELPSEREK